jgi:hypothetical protein
MKCSKCRFALKDKQASNISWTAYQCGNINSEYYGCLLNTSKSGNTLRRITWSGCKFGEYVIQKEGEKY